MAAHRRLQILNCRSKIWRLSVSTSEEESIGKRRIDSMNVQWCAFCLTGFVWFWWFFFLLDLVEFGSRVRDEDCESWLLRKKNSEGYFQFRSVQATLVATSTFQMRVCFKRKQLRIAFQHMNCIIVVILWEYYSNFPFGEEIGPFRVLRASWAEWSSSWGKLVK